jgi:hypothetical protein
LPAALDGFVDQMPEEVDGDHVRLLLEPQFVLPDLAADPAHNDWIVTLAASTCGANQVEQKRPEHERDHANHAHDRQDHLLVFPQIVHVPTDHCYTIFSL